MDAATLLNRLREEKRAIKDLVDPLRVRIKDLNGQIAGIEVNLTAIDDKIAALVEVLDLGLDKE